MTIGLAIFILIMYLMYDFTKIPTTPGEILCYKMFRG